ncbi:MAG: ribonuclease III [Lachnospiraceae bacterium]|nr:ribonuclease III [Lachnospiraceae bacterium]
MNEALYKEFNLPEFEADQYPPLDLAYIGDCAYELVIRTCILSEGASAVDKLNRRASNLAKAVTQAKMVTGIMDLLTEEEQGIYRRGRNAKSYSPAKNATLGEYHKATGFEAVIGWLYLKKEYARMFEIIHKGFEIVAGCDKDDPEQAKEQRIENVTAGEEL